MKNLEINKGYFMANQNFDLTPFEFKSAKEEPFTIHGLYDPKAEGPFRRLPDEIGENVNERVALLYKNTAGGRVRFITDSPRIAIRTGFDGVCARSIMSLLNTVGYDVYVRRADGEHYFNTFRPPVDAEDHYENVMGLDGGVKEITLYMPIYNNVDFLEIGVEKGSVLKKAPAYKSELPVLFYGSSITQGASASRPGNTYVAMTARLLDTDFINLGFASGAKGEEIMADYIAGQSFSAFVMDYDHNAPTPEHLRETHLPMYKKVRANHPDAPIILMSRPVANYSFSANIQRRNIVHETYRYATEHGDTNTYFVDGFSIFGTDAPDDCFADGIHPNDLGNYRMSRAVAAVLRHALSK